MHDIRVNSCVITLYLVSEAHSFYAPPEFRSQMLNYMVKTEEAEEAATDCFIQCSLFRTNISGVIWLRGEND